MANFEGTLFLFYFFHRDTHFYFQHNFGRLQMEKEEKVCQCRNTIKNGKREVTISGAIDGINLSDPIFIINGSTNDSVGSSKIEIVSFNWDNM